MRFVQSYARAHAHAYPHTPTRIRMRTHTCSSFKQTGHCRGGLSLQTLSSEERLRRAPFLTVLGTHCISRSFPLPPQRMLASLAAVSVAAGPASHAHPVSSKLPRNQTPHAYAAFCVGVPAVVRCPPPSHAGRGEYSGSVLLSDVPPPLREAQTPASAAFFAHARLLRDNDRGRAGMDSCQCVGYGISSVVLLSLCLLFFGCNLYLARARPQRALEAELL